MARTVVVLVGPAGSGKTSLAAAYSKWLREGGLEAGVANFDPAVEALPYEPCFDVRRHVDAREVARKYGLGPNGALVKSLEMASGKLGDLVAEIDENCPRDYVIVDTPGQMEVFLFRGISWRLVEALQRLGTVYALFVIDGSVIERPEDYGFLLLVASTVSLRLGVEAAPVINKADLLPGEWYTGDLTRDYGRLSRALRESRTLYAEMLRELLRSLLKYSKRIEVPRVSAVRGEGLEDLHRLVLEMGCGCGDLS